MPPGAYRTGAAITQALLNNRNSDPNDPEYARLYFQRLFGALDIDREEVQKARQRLNYPDTSRLFKMIDDDTESVVVRYGNERKQQEIEDLLQTMTYIHKAKLAKGAKSSPRAFMRKLQPFVVSIRRKEVEKNRDLIEEIMSGISRWNGKYDDLRGWVGDVDKDSLSQW